MTLYPIDKIDKEADYFALTLIADPDGRIVLGGQSIWVGFDEQIDKGQRVELRTYSIVNVDFIASFWQNEKMPFCVVNDIVDFIQWYNTGGHALIQKQVAQQIIPDQLQPKPVVCTGAYGFTSFKGITKAIFNKAPTKKKRMEILKRDGYRCRCCGRSPSNHVDIELHVHHIRPFGQRGVTHEDNLITLCSTCHDGLAPHFDWQLFSLLKEDNYQDDISKTTKAYYEGVRQYRNVQLEQE